MHVFGEGRSRRLRIIRNSTAVSAAVLLAACGGGGGGVSSPGGNAPPTGTPAPTPPATPAPTPPPTPTPTSAADAPEYKASGAVVSAKAAYAYDRGITGKGVTIAILDTGIDVSGREFAGRISPDSTAFDQAIARCATCPPETIRFDVKDVKGHGSRVAGIAAAARDGASVQGVAPGATILALKLSGPDLTNVTPGSGPVPEGDGANAALIAPAIRYALDKGAFVISMSLNGVATGKVAAEQRAAMDAVRQADRLLVESISNFTDEDSFTGTIAENLVGTDRANKDWFLFAIGVTENGTPRLSNGNAGPLADRMIAAAGNEVRTVDQNGAVVVETGNSFAAPAVAGAAALLRQHWPQLGGRAIARILLDTATDAGAPGVDPVFGVGILNVEKAMQAQAPASSFVAAQAVLARYSSLTMSAPFGGGAAIAGRTSTMTVLDRYGRDFAMTGTSGIRTRGSGLLAGAMLGSFDAPWQRTDATDARLGFSSSVPAYWQAVRPNRPAMVSFSPAPGQTVTLGANVLVGSGDGIAGSPLRGVVDAPVGTTSAWTGSGWSAGFSSGSSRDARTELRGLTFSTPLGFGFEISDMVERGQALGMRGGVELGLDGARTTMASLTARRMIAGVLVSARATASTTRVVGGSEMMRFSGPVRGSAFAVEGARRLLGGTAMLGVSSPLRVERARSTLLVPVAYDLMTGALTTTTTMVDLAPDARELDLEIGWSTSLSRTSSLRLGVARAFDAGHVAGASDTAGFVALVLR
ncbi:MAG: S8 family serine peptidase [Sphingomonas adhaesiva]|uniref:S8 family serine peptidase n=1 Tax=Sphingomonas adhaesiva TaxID=28212 RepID=UPI002FF6EA41